MISDNEAQFLAVIRAEPNSDGPRLVYADWLGQWGDVRGEQIVAECQLEHEPSRERRNDLEARANKIRPKLRFLGYDFVLPVDTIVLGVLEEWSRGFVPASTVFCHVEEFANAKDELYRLAPCAKKLRMYAYGSTPPWETVLADPDVTRWGAIDTIPTEHARAVARAPRCVIRPAPGFWSWAAR